MADMDGIAAARVDAVHVQDLGSAVDAATPAFWALAGAVRNDAAVGIVEPFGHGLVGEDGREPAALGEDAKVRSPGETGQVGAGNALALLDVDLPLQDLPEPPPLDVPGLEPAAIYPVHPDGKENGPRVMVDFRKTGKSPLWFGGGGAGSGTGGLGVEHWWPTPAIRGQKPAGNPRPAS